MPHDERADLYSLGVLTWLLFTGRMPGSQPPVQPRPEADEMPAGFVKFVGLPDLVLAAYPTYPYMITSFIAQVHQHLYDWLLLRKCLDDSGQRQTLRILAG